MPKERIIHGRIYVIEAEGATDVEDVHGNPVGPKAHRVHEYEPGEKLGEGDILTEHPSFDFNWSKMTDEPGNGFAQLSVSIPRDFLEQALSLTPVEEPLVIFSDTLSRAELNRMIRVTRHVRNSAHGVDE